MKHVAILVLTAVAVLGFAGCKKDSAAKKTSKSSSPAPGGAQPAGTPAPQSHAGHDHGHGDHAHDAAADHAHDQEVPLGTATVGDVQVTLAQGHGVVAAGKESHLVVKLPYSDKGSTVVRAWLGTADRTRSMVGKGAYAPSHDDYDIHATAPQPLPENVMWWIEIQKPDGTKMVGSAKPKL